VEYHTTGRAFQNARPTPAFRMFVATL
jgi:hypothetical protein